MDYNRFYIPDITSLVDIQEDYLKWFLSKAEIVSPDVVSLPCRSAESEQKQCGKCLWLWDLFSLLCFTESTHSFHGHWEGIVLVQFHVITGQVTSLFVMFSRKWDHPPLHRCSFKD